MKPIIICLMGPTASGKTQLAIELRQQLSFEIISVDSAMVYRGMDIGTAKPTREEQKIAPHRLIDICDPKEVYSAGQFRNDALHEIEIILQQGKIPLLVGGTMLYFHVLQQGLSDLPTADLEVRNKIAQEAERIGWEAMHKRLQEIDPTAAKRIHPNDPQRISRALEIYKLTGKSLSQIATGEKRQLLPYHIMNIALAPQDRSILHERIAKRFKQMLQRGFIEEVERLYQRGDLHPDLPSMRTVGYRQVWDYIAGKLSYEEMQEKAISCTRQLAKRQLTWLRSWQNITWLDSESDELNKSIIPTLLNKMES